MWAYTGSRGADYDWENPWAGYDTGQSWRQKNHIPADAHATELYIISLCGLRLGLYRARVTATRLGLGLELGHLGLGLGLGLEGRQNRLRLPLSLNQC